MRSFKNITLLIVVAAIVGSIFYLDSLKPKRSGIQGSGTASSAISIMSKGEKSKQYSAAQELTGIQGYINTPSTSSGQAAPITIGELIGKKVILVDFWTYSCINCQRTTPYLNSWYEKYRDNGLEIIGVHTPEFDFEKKKENVELAVKKFGIQYPVVQDNDYATWNAYRNRYWPRKYLIDIDGFIVYDHIGEGAYEETEGKIRALLEERAKALGENKTIEQGTAQPINAAAVDPNQSRSPEIYFGSSRNLALGNGKSETSGAQTLKEPSEVKTNTLYMTGGWIFQPEYAESKTANSKIIFRYQGKELYFVGSSENGVNVKFLIDGKPLGNFSGEDITKDSSSATIKEDRLYKIIQDSSYGEHTIEMIIKEPGLRAFTFTFG